jgi:hypothetical protein
MKRVVYPCTYPYPWGSGTRHIDVFCRVELDTNNKGQQRLSITGVVGPKVNGNAWGGCGQIDQMLRQDLPKLRMAEGWDRAKLTRFLDIWDKWHLNDMRAYDQEMQAAGWDVLARKEMLGWRYRLKAELLASRASLKENTRLALARGETVQYSPEQQKLVNLPHELVIWRYADEAEPAPPEGYERAKSLYAHGGAGAPEHKTLGWLYPKDHPDGLLGRKLRPDGPAYGSGWYYHPLPDDVVEFLTSLPRSEKHAAWV